MRCRCLCRRWAVSVKVGQLSNQLTGVGKSFMPASIIAAARTMISRQECPELPRNCGEFVEQNCKKEDELQVAILASSVRISQSEL